MWYWRCMRCMKKSKDKEMTATLSESVRTPERLLRSPARYNKDSERCPEEAPLKNRPWCNSDELAMPFCEARFLVTIVVQTLSLICARMHCLVRSENEHFRNGYCFFERQQQPDSAQSSSPSEEPILCASYARLWSRSKRLHLHTSPARVAADSLNMLLCHSGLLETLVFTPRHFSITHLDVKFIQHVAGWELRRQQRQNQCSGRTWIECKQSLPQGQSVWRREQSSVP